MRTILAFVQTQRWWFLQPLFAIAPLSSLRDVIARFNNLKNVLIITLRCLSPPVSAYQLFVFQWRVMTIDGSAFCRVRQLIRKSRTGTFCFLATTEILEFVP